ncbi:MAG TPA: hypothetical protein VFE61_05155 [Candidatus Sulfotelmatobacter sp.]|nr:hypothetical protein [Candidatus Sulfotelmatobacter sp.]
MNKRLVFFPAFFAILSFAGFLHTSNAESVKAMQIVFLIATGMCLGVSLAHLVVQLRGKSQS